MYAFAVKWLFIKRTEDVIKTAIKAFFMAFFEYMGTKFPSTGFLIQLRRKRDFLEALTTYSIIPIKT